MDNYGRLRYFSTIQNLRLNSEDKSAREGETPKPFTVAVDNKERMAVAAYKNEICDYSDYCGGGL